MSIRYKDRVPPLCTQEEGKNMIRKISILSFLICGTALAQAEARLYSPVRNNEPQKLLRLLQANPSLNLEARQPTLLQMAAYLGFTEVAQILMDHGADFQSTSRSRIWDGSSALHLAAVQDNLPLLQMMLKTKPDLEQKDRRGRSPLIAAACRGSGQAVRVLADAGAKLEPQDAAGQTALHCAVRRGHLLAVEALIDAGAQLNIKDRSGYTPLLRAVRFYRLLDGFPADAFFSPRLLVAEGPAFWERGVSIAIALTEAGADPYWKDRFGNTAMTYLDFSNLQAAQTLQAN